jgi:hypothetical protein
MNTNRHVVIAPRCAADTERNAAVPADRRLCWKAAANRRAGR